MELQGAQPTTQYADTPFPVLHATQRLTTAADFPFITHPENFPSLVAAPDKEKLPEVLQEISRLLDVYELNATLLCDLADPLPCVMNLAMELASRPSALKVCLQLFKRLLKGSVVKVDHYELVYQEASCRAARCRSQESLQEHYRFFYVCGKLLKMMAKHDPLPSDKHCSYFYFTPINSRINVKLPPLLAYPFASGFTFAAWVKIFSVESRRAEIFRIRSTTTKFQLSLAGKTLIYNSNQTDTPLADIEPNKWTCILLSHKAKDKSYNLNFWNDTKSLITNASFPCMKPNEGLEEIMLFEGFSGLVSSCMLLQENFAGTKLKEIAENFPLGITRDDLPKELPAKKSPKDDSLIKNSFLAFAPFYCANKKVIYNISSSMNIKGKLEGNCNVVRREPVYLNRTQSLLPFFQVARGFYGTQGTQLMELLLKVIRKYLKNLELNFRGDVRAAKERSCLVKVLEYQLRITDPAAVSLEFLNQLNGLIFPEIQEKIALMLITTMDMWVNTDLAVFTAYLEILHINTKLHSFSNSLMNPITLLYIMRIMSKFDALSFYCCQYTASEDRTCCFLNQRYKPMVDFMLKLTADAHKTIEVTTLAMFKLILKKPLHCLLNAAIEIMTRLCKLESFRKFIGSHKGFYVLCCSVGSYPVDTKVLCLKLGRRILELEAAGNYDEVHSGVSAVFSSFPHNRAPSKTCSICKEGRRRSKSIDELRTKDESALGAEGSFPVSSEVNIAYEYLLDWITRLDTNTQETAPFAWLILLCKKTASESLLVKAIEIVDKAAGKTISLKRLSEVRGLVKWLLEIESAMYFSVLPLSVYRKVVGIHVRVLVEAAKDKVNGMSFFRKHIEYVHRKKMGEVSSLNFLWRKVMASLNKSDLNFALQFAFEFTFGIAYPIDSKTHKDFLFGLPVCCNSTLLLGLFRLIGNYCNSFTAFFFSPSSLKDEFTIRSLALMKQLKAPSIFSSSHREIMLITYIFVIFSVAVHRTKDHKLIRKYFSLTAPLINYSLILLEFAKYKRESGSLKQITNALVFFISFLINCLSRGRLFTELVIQVIRKIMSYASVPQSASLDLCYEIFTSEVRDSNSAVYKEERNEAYISELKSKFLKFLVFNEYIKEIGNQIKQAQSKSLLITQKSKLKYERLKKAIMKRGLLFEKENRQMVLKLLAYVEVQRRACVHKHQKVHKAAKRWRGLWRDKELFDCPFRVSAVPCKVSSHSFANSVRCLTEVRGYTCKYLRNSKLEVYVNDFAKDKAKYLLLNGVLAIDVLKSRLVLRAYNPNSIVAMLRTSVSSVVEFLGTAEERREAFLMECEIVEFLLLKPGRMYLMSAGDEVWLKFVYGPMCFVKDRKNDNRLMFTYTHPHDKKFTKKFHLKELHKMYKKQMIEAATALELFFMNGKTVLLNFSSEEHREIFCSKLTKIIKKAYKDKSIPIFDGRKSLHDKYSDKMDLTQNWLSYNISNFDYLLALNQFSSRSFNNSAQYPVFPWILRSYDDVDPASESACRDFSRCVGMMGDPVRAELFREKFKQADVSGLGACNYGSHYSSPGIVMQFMMRLFPFLEGYIEFFDGLDNPNRMFFSIADTFNSVCTDSSDVRELIPEVYSIPEMFVNSLEKSFGVREEDKKPINDVALPQWANSSPHTFVLVQRMLLESVNVSTNIQRWLDLIFGYQQRGKEAEEAHNVFPGITTEPAKTLAECLPEQREDYRLQAYQWGQTPQLLFPKPHPQKSPPNAPDLVCDENVRIESFNYESIKAMEIEQLQRKRVNATLKSNYVALKIKENLPNGIRFIAITADGEILENSAECIRPPGSVHSFSVKWQPPKINPYSNLLQYKVVSSRNPPLVVINREKTEQIAQGGYLDGSIRLISLASPSNSVVVNISGGVITALAVDTGETFAVAGTQDGECAVFSVEEGLRWSCTRHLREHKRRVNSACISSEMQLFATASADGTANVYSKGLKPKLIRTLHHPSHLELDHAIMSANPLPCVILYSNADGTVYSYSINGCLLHSVKISPEILVFPHLIRNSFFNDFLIYVDKAKNAVVTRKLPGLELANGKQLSKSISAFAVSSNSRFGILGHRDGSFSLIYAAPPKDSLQPEKQQLSTKSTK